MKRFALFLLCLLPLPALAGQSIPSGVTDQYIYFKLVDATDNVTPETGISAFTVYYSKDGGASTQISTPTINEVDATNMPGVYELLVNTGTTVTTGNVIENMVITITATGCAPSSVVIEIVDAANEASIVDEMESQMQADPTGFHVNVLEVEGSDATDTIASAVWNALLATYSGTSGSIAERISILLRTGVSYRHTNDTSSEQEDVTITEAP